MLTLAWESDNRLEVTAKCLSVYRSLMADDAQLMTLFGKTPGEEELNYMRSSILRFKGDPEVTLDYLMKVAEIEGKGESLGFPSRDLVIQRLDEHGLDKRKATQSIREEYHRRRDVELKEEYRRKKAEEEARKEKEAREAA